MLRRMSSVEYTGWKAFFSVEPWGWLGAWERTARTCATLANTRMGATTPISDEAFMPKRELIDETPKRQNVSQMKATADAIAAASARRFKGRKKSKPKRKGK